MRQKLYFWGLNPNAGRGFHSQKKHVFRYKKVQKGIKLQIVKFLTYTLRPAFGWALFGYKPKRHVFCLTLPHFSLFLLFKVFHAKNMKNANFD